MRIKLFFKHPFAVIRAGIKACEENFHKNEIKRKFNIDKLPTIDLLNLFPESEETVNFYSFLSGTSLISDILLLKKLAKSYSNCSYIEIGSWRGESIVNVAEVTKDCTAVTLSEKEMKDFGFTENFIKVHGFFAKYNSNIKIIEGNSFIFDFSQLNKLFDLIFIDGDHSFEGVRNDTRKIFKLRKNRDSIIVWHDYSNNIENTRYSVLHGILDAIPKKYHHNIFHVSNTLCAIYTENNKIKHEYLEFPAIPNKNFKINLKIDKI